MVCSKLCASAFWLRMKDQEHLFRGGHDILGAQLYTDYKSGTNSRRDMQVQSRPLHPKALSIRIAGRQDTHVKGLHKTAWRSAAFTVGAQSQRHFQPLKLL